MTQSVLEQELNTLVLRMRSWLWHRDRAAIAGALLCCVPFLPVTLIGVLVTAANLGLVAARRLPRAELPLLIAGLCIAVLYCIGWWLLFWHLRASSGWIGHVIFQWRVLPFWHPLQAAPPASGQAI